MGHTIATARISLDAMPLHRDLHLPVDYSARLVAESVISRLFVEEGAPGGGCAEKAECLGDGRRWRVSLDGTRRWSDGRPLDAQDVVEAVGHAIEKRSNGVALFLAGSTYGDPPVRALGRTEVEFHFDRPLGFAAALLTLPAFAPRRGGSDAHGRTLSLGGYAVTRWSGEEITLARTGAPTPLPGSPDEVRFLHVPRAAHAVKRFLDGELDATSPTGFGVAEVAALRGRTDVRAAPVDIFGTLDLGRRAPRPWRASGAARRSLSAVLDRARLGSAAAGLAEPWAWPCAEALGQGALQGPADDAVLTRLRKDVEGPIDVAYSAFDPNAEIAEELADQLARALGIEVTTTRLSFAEYVRATASRDHCLLYSLTTPMFSHPAGSLSDWRSTGRAARRCGLTDPVLDAALDAAEGCLDPGGADRLWARAADRWCELLPKVPLVRVRAWYLRGGQLAGLTVTRTGLMSFTPG